jgi:hypothetical protein
MATEVLHQQVAAIALEAGAVFKLGLHPACRLTLAKNRKSSYVKDGILLRAYRPFLERSHVLS